MSIKLSSQNAHKCYRTKSNDRVLIFHRCNQNISISGVLIDEFSPEGTQLDMNTQYEYISA